MGEQPPVHSSRCRRQLDGRRRLEKPPAAGRSSQVENSPAPPPPRRRGCRTAAFQSPVADWDHVEVLIDSRGLAQVRSDQSCRYGLAGELTTD